MYFLASLEDFLQVGLAFYRSPLDVSNNFISDVSRGKEGIQCTLIALMATGGLKLAAIEAAANHG